MSTSGQHPDMPHLDAVEADPAYDYAGETPADAALDPEDPFPGAEEPAVRSRPVNDAEDREVPMDPDEVRGDEQD